jgi:hypothetical protein
MAALPNSIKETAVREIIFMGKILVRQFHV